MTRTEFLKRYDFIRKKERKVNKLSFCSPKSRGIRQLSPNWPIKHCRETRVSIRNDSNNEDEASVHGNAWILCRLKYRPREKSINTFNDFSLIVRHAGSSIREGGTRLDRSYD